MTLTKQAVAEPTSLNLAVQILVKDYIERAKQEKRKIGCYFRTIDFRISPITTAITSASTLAGLSRSSRSSAARISASLCPCCRICSTRRRTTSIAGVAASLISRLRFFFVIAPGPVERHRVGRSISRSIRSFTASTVKRLLPCTLMKTDWEGPLDAAVPPVCVDALAALPPPNEGRLPPLPGLVLLILAT